MAQFFKIERETLEQHALRKAKEQWAIEKMAAETMERAEDDREYNNAASARFDAMQAAMRWEELA